MNQYSGFLNITPHLTEQEVSFLNEWQNILNETYSKIKTKQPDAVQKIEKFLNFSFTKEQLWTICEWTYSPMITWNQEGMVIEGEHQKGQLRPAILGYLHFFLGKEPILKNCFYEQLSFLREHTLNGIIDCDKITSDNLYNSSLGYITTEKSNKQWLYVVENNAVSSVNQCSIDQYLLNPSLYNKITQEDNCIDKINKYFSNLYNYSKVVKIVYENPNINTSLDKKMKI